MEWLLNKSEHVQVMRSLISTSLKKAHAKNLNSIALPAVGTGNLKVPPAFCASVMYDEISTFSKAQPTTTLRDIRIVVYDKDVPTVTVRLQTFEVFWLMS
jgi:poly [ADP-ribose] polymerase 10/14/15